MIGYASLSKGRIEYAFDLNCPERKLLARKAFQSKFHFKTRVILTFFFKLSSGLFFEKHLKVGWHFTNEDNSFINSFSLFFLKFIKLSEQFVPFTKMNMTYLLKVSSMAAVWHAIKFFSLMLPLPGILTSIHDKVSCFDTSKVWLD